MSRSVCPGCGASLPASGQPWDPRLNASPECWFVYGEIAGFELEHAAELGRFHQLCVDAYGAQHPGDGSGIRVAYSLVGLWLALERGATGLEVRTVHQRMGRPDGSWPRFEPPPDRGDLRAVDVAEAGARAGSVEGHADAAGRWAVSVWDAWRDQQDAVASLAGRVT